MGGLTRARTRRGVRKGNKAKITTLIQGGIGKGEG